MLKKLGRIVLVALSFVAVSACSALSGSEMIAETEVPRERLIAGFADLKSKSRQWPLRWPEQIRLQLDRPAPNELIFRIPSSEVPDGTTFHLRFVDGSKPGATAIHLTSSIAKVGELAGSDEGLMFRENAKVLIDEIANGLSGPSVATNFTAQFYNISLESNPAQKAEIHAKEEESTNARGEPTP